MQIHYSGFWKQDGLGQIFSKFGTLGGRGRQEKIGRSENYRLSFISLTLAYQSFYRSPQGIRTI
jgi:hypothetical protein